MTVEELIVRLYEGSYEQDDLNPYDIDGNVDWALSGTALIVSHINRAIKIISTWKFPNGIRIRFRSNEGAKYITTPETGYSLFFNDPTGVASNSAGYSLEDDAINSVATNVVRLPAAFSRVDDYYAGAILSLGDEATYFVISSTRSELLLKNQISTDYNGYPFKIHLSAISVGSGVQNTIRLPEFISLRDIYDYTSGGELSRSQSTRSLDISETSIGAPTSYQMYGNKLYFDIALQLPYILKIRYWKYPVPVTALDGFIDLPEAFHDAVLLCAKADLLRRNGEATEAYAAQKALESLMITLRTETDFEQDNEGARVYPED